jgi:hypothetical protein
MMSTHLGMKMPSDFPTEKFDHISIQVNKLYSRNPDEVREMMRAWKGVAHRFLTLSDYDEEYTKLMKNTGVNLSTEDQYLQDKYLYCFFVNGLSTVETLIYALFALGAFVMPNEFSLANQQNIKPPTTKQKYNRFFSQESISNLLNNLLSSTEYKELKDVRNYIAHRKAASRVIYMSPPENNTPPDKWKNIPLNENTTQFRRTWMSQQLSLFMDGIIEFLDHNF